MLIAGLTTVRTPVDVISHCVKVKMFTCISRNVLFLWLRKTRYIWCPEPNFEEHRQSSLKCMKLGLLWTGCMGALPFYGYTCWHVLFIWRRRQ